MCTSIVGLGTTAKLAAQDSGTWLFSPPVGQVEVDVVEKVVGVAINPGQILLPAHLLEEA